MKKWRIPSLRISLGFILLLGMVGDLVAQEKTSEAERIWMEETIRDHEIQRSAPGSGFHSVAKAGVADLALPNSLIAPEGKLTVHAVPREGDGGGAIIYLVNRTGKGISIPSQDGDLFFKLEVRDDSGAWVRAQNHLDSGCGNSYFPKTLAPGLHFVLEGYLPAAGEAARVRYRCAKNPDLVSNEFEGRYLRADRTAATFDDLAAADISPSLRDYFFVKGLYHGGFLRMRDSFPQGIVEAFYLISLRAENAYYRRMAERLFRVLPAGSEERDELGAILDKPWPDQFEPEAFFAKCLEVADAPQPENPIDEPGRAAFAWWAIGDALAAQTTSGSGPIGAEAIASAYRQLDSVVPLNNRRATAAAARLLTFSEMTRDHIDTEALFEWTRTTNETFFSATCGALARRREWERLVELGHAGPGNRRLVVLRHLAKSEGDGNQLRSPGSDREKGLWQKCAREEPLRTVEILYSAANQDEVVASYFWNFLRPPLRDFLAKEAGLDPDSVDPGTGHSRSLSVSRVVSFLGAIGAKEDVALFRSLLGHPFYDEFTRSDADGHWSRMRRYPVRDAVQKVLRRMKEPVPSDLVIEEPAPAKD